MADHAAAREAEELLEETRVLRERIERAIAQLEAARGSARTSLDRVGNTAAKSRSLLDFMEQEKRRGRSLQGQLSEESEKLEDLLSEVAETRQYEAPALTSSSVQPALTFPSELQELPNFAAPRRELLWQDASSKSRISDRWDSLAEETRTFRDLQAEALARLEVLNKEIVEQELHQRRRSRGRRSKIQERKGKDYD